MKIVLAELIPFGMDKDLVAQRLEELQQLIETYWWLTVLKVIQQKAHPDYRLYLGSWKIEEIKEDMQLLWADVLIIWNILKPGQIYNINEEMKKIGKQARDRVDLILKIFERHAQSMEARLQIQLASIKHMGPRIFGMGMELSRQGWWSALARWLGETNTEIMKRHLAKKIKQIEHQLSQYDQVRTINRESRKKKSLSTVWLVGYTNAGKSSLMNTLTHKGVLVANKLFATLWTSVGELYFPNILGKGEKILINDTIGFIRDLPPALIKAFRSTLEDSIEADLLLHVVDAGDILMDDKLCVVNNILDNIGAHQARILVFNKIDLISSERKKTLIEKFWEKAFYISSVNWTWIEELKKYLSDYVLESKLECLAVQ